MGDLIAGDGEAEAFEDMLADFEESLEPFPGPVWFGPYKVLYRYKTSFRLAIPKESKMHPVVHASHLKLHYNPISTQPHRTYQVHPVRLEE